MTVVFVTGDIGAGKSSFCAALGALGAAVISSDELVSEIYAEDAGVIESLEGALGVQLRDPAGELNRAKLAELVFASPTARGAVEAIVHPLVAARLRRRLSLESSPLIAYEVTALKTTTDTALADVVCEVVASPDVRLRRLVARGYTEAEALQRIQAQLDDPTRRHDVDVIADNSGDQQKLNELAASLYLQWTGRHDEA